MECDTTNSLQTKRNNRQIHTIIITHARRRTHQYTHACVKWKVSSIFVVCNDLLRCACHGWVILMCWWLGRNHKRWIEHKKSWEKNYPCGSEIISRISLNFHLNPLAESGHFYSKRHCFCFNAQNTTTNIQYTIFVPIIAISHSFSFGLKFSSGYIIFNFRVFLLNKRGPFTFASRLNLQTEERLRWYFSSVQGHIFLSLRLSISADGLFWLKLKRSFNKKIRIF